jgi:hypothetical protein
VQVAATTVASHVPVEGRKPDDANAHRYLRVDRTVFGNNVEDHIGRVKYHLFYIAAGFVATAAHVAGDPSSTIPVIGASGAVAGMTGAWIVLAFWFASQFFISPSEGFRAQQLGGREIVQDGHTPTWHTGT